MEYTMREKECTECQKILPISSFYTNGKTPKGTQKYKGRCKACEMEVNNRQFIEKLENILGGNLQCDICGYNRCFAALEFHHIDGSTKENSISNMRTRSENSIRQEIEKCVLLCANCHREVHNGILEDII